MTGTRMTPRKHPPTVEERGLAFAQMLRLVVAAAREEWPVALTNDWVVVAALIAAAAELVKGTELGDNP